MGMGREGMGEGWFMYGNEEEEGGMGRKGRGIFGFEEGRWWEGGGGGGDGICVVLIIWC